MDHTIAEQLARAVEQARTENAARRDRVLSHPDLTARLALVLGLTDPTRWSGWIPPRTDPVDVRDCCREGTCRAHRLGSARANTSYVRRQLVEIAAEALRREQQPALDEIEPA